MQNKVVRLLEEKRDILKQLLQMKEMQVRQGGGDVSAEDIITATLALLEVELELAPSRATRIAILEKMVQQSQLSEARAKSQRDAGVAGGATVLEAHLKSLEYRLRLEREKAPRNV